MVLVTLFASLLALVARETEAQPREYDVKADFLLSFAQFVEWPEDAFPVPGDPLVVGVAGKDPFGSILDRLVQGRTAQGRSFVVRRFRRPEALEPCHILFIAASENPDPWLAALDERGRGFALTVGEGPDFRHKGAIAFLIQSRRLRLAINLDAIEESRLRVSSRLLSVAQVLTRGFKDVGR